MLSASQIKFIRSLAQKKERDTTGLFLAEGKKTISELIHYFKCNLLILPKEETFECTEKVQQIIYASPKEIERASLQKTPQGMIAVFQKPIVSPQIMLPENDLSLALDGIQNPGNLGTIIRLADWFGIKKIICSLDTADAFGPKTVQATMGALGRVTLHYTELTSFLANALNRLPIYGTFLGGESIYTATLPPNGIIVMGNEGNGISNDVAQLIQNKIEIPSFSNGAETSESLNVAIATAIVCAEFRRRSLPIG